MRVIFDIREIFDQRVVLEKWEIFQMREIFDKRKTFEKWDIFQTREIFDIREIFDKGEIFRKMGDFSDEGESKELNILGQGKVY